jgi:hypothetical protein
MSGRRLWAPWEELCGEEREVILDHMTEAGRTAGWKALRSGLLDGSDTEAFCFPLFRYEVVSPSVEDDPTVLASM